MNDAINGDFYDVFFLFWFCRRLLVPKELLLSWKDPPPCYNSILIGNLYFQDLMMTEIESHFHTAVRVDRRIFCILVKLCAGAQATKFCLLIMSFLQ
jgi:hypothetical protein